MEQQELSGAAAVPPVGPATTAIFSTDGVEQTTEHPDIDRSRAVVSSSTASKRTRVLLVVGTRELENAV